MLVADARTVPCNTIALDDRTDKCEIVTTKPAISDVFHIL